MTQSIADTLNTLLPTPIAENGDKNSSLPQGADNTTDESVSSSFGFPEIFSRSISKDGGKPIQRDEMNTLFNILSRQITYFQLGGVATWKASVASSSYFDGYPPNAIVWHRDCEWRNVGGTTNKTEPGTDSAIGWTQIGPTAGTGTTSLDSQKLCPTINDWRQLIDWSSISKKTVPASGQEVTGFLPSGHPDKADDVGYLVGKGIEIVLKDSWWNWQTLCFLVDTATNGSSPDIQFTQVPSVYLYMGMIFRQANISKGTKKLANYRFGLDNANKSGDFDANMLWIDLSKDFEFKKFTMGGGGYIRAIYGTGDCSSCRTESTVSYPSTVAIPYNINVYYENGTVAITVGDDVTVSQTSTGGTKTSPTTWAHSGTTNSSETVTFTLKKDGYQTTIVNQTLTKKVSTTPVTHEYTQDMTFSCNGPYQITKNANIITPTYLNNLAGTIAETSTVLIADDKGTEWNVGQTIGSGCTGMTMGTEATQFTVSGLQEGDSFTATAYYKYTTNSTSTYFE